MWTVCAPFKLIFAGLVFEEQSQTKDPEKETSLSRLNIKGSKNTEKRTTTEGAPNMQNTKQGHPGFCMFAFYVLLFSCFVWVLHILFVLFVFLLASSFAVCFFSGILCFFCLPFVYIIGFLSDLYQICWFLDRARFGFTEKRTLISDYMHLMCFIS